MDKVISDHQWNVLDDQFTVTARVFEYHIAFKIYRLVALKAENRPFWPIIGGKGSGDWTDDLSKAEMFAHGDVKWDGCSNWYIDEQEVVMIHGCSRKCLTSIGEVLAFCWDKTEELCLKWYL